MEGAQAQNDRSAKERSIVVGRVSADPEKTYPRLEKLAQYLARRLAPLGITAGGAMVAEDNRTMIRYLSQGKVDLVSETVLSALLFSDETGAEILLREWKKGVPWYYTVFITRKGSGITTLAHLRGRKIAFEDPGSTTGFLLPLAMLKREGLETVELSSPRDTAPADKVGYAFVTAEVAIAASVVRGLADAGAFSDRDWNEVGRTPGPLKKRLEIFHMSRPLIRSLILARRGLRPEIKARVKETLLGMHDDPEGADVLKAYYEVKKYDEIEGEVSKSLDEARRVFGLVRTEIE